MINIVLIIVTSIILALSFIISILALFRNQSRKKSYFILMQAMLIVSLLGSLLELISITDEQAYAAAKLINLGSYFFTLFTFFFVADYSEIRLHRIFIKAPLVIITLAAIILMWLSKYNRLVYDSYYLVTDYIHHLVFSPGPLYFWFRLYLFSGTALALLALLSQIKKWTKKYRNQLYYFILCLSIPFIAEGVYLITLYTGINPQKIQLTTYPLALMSFCIYLKFMRFNIFEIISIGTLTAMEYINEGFVLLDENNNYLSSNHAALMIFPDMAKLKMRESIFSIGCWPGELKDIQSGTAEFSISSGNTAFNPRYYEASISPILAKNKKLRARIFLLEDITGRVNFKRDLENAAYTDVLTELNNRKHFSELANVEIERAKRMNQSIYTVMLDLDFFKKVNDTYGHAAGDLVLKTAAGIIRKTIRSYDLSGRYGGEEFTLMITDLDPQEAFNLMERIRENMENSITYYDDKTIKITCSIGLTKLSESDTLESSLKKADEALYTAKHSGRNRIHFR